MIKKIKFRVFVFCIITLLGSSFCRCVFTKGIKAVFAQDESRDFEEVKLYVAEPKIISASNPKRVAVSKPEVADVQSVSASEVALEPKSPGVTALFIWDDYGQHAYQLRVFSEDLSGVKQHADSLIGELKLSAVTTKINELEGKIILLGEVNDLNEKERLLSALGSLRNKFLDFLTIKEELTLIQSDVQIVEMTRDNLKTLGIEYQKSVSLTDDANKKLNKLTDIFATSRWTRGKLDLIINTFVKEGKARILSQPKLVCLSGKEAEFLVGGQIPILTSTLSTTGTTSNVQYRDYGITLKIKPTAKEGGNIFLNLSTEVSDIDESNAVGNKSGSSFFAPAFTTRNTKTELYLKDGQSVIIAGLIKNKDTNTVKKFPFLGDVPILGMLWRSRDFQNNQTELVILITPSIVNRPLIPTAKTASNNAPSRKEYEQDVNLSSEVYKPQGSFNSYVEDLQGMIIASLDYPSLSSELGGLEGTVKVRLRILSDGQLKNVLVISSSGIPLLDKTAVDTIKKIAPFPSFPSSWDTNEIAIDIPIVYS